MRDMQFEVAFAAMAIVTEGLNLAEQRGGLTAEQATEARKAILDGLVASAKYTVSPEAALLGGMAAQAIVAGIKANMDKDFQAGDVQ